MARRKRIEDVIAADLRGATQIIQNINQVQYYEFLILDVRSAFLRANPRRNFFVRAAAGNLSPNFDMISGGSGTGAGSGAPSSGDGVTYENATPQEVQGWIRTESADAIDPQALTDIQSKLAQDDPQVWSDPIYVAESNGQTYVIDGHHRLNAAADPPAGFNGNIPVVKVPTNQLQSRFGIDPDDLASMGLGPIGTGN